MDRDRTSKVIAVAIVLVVIIAIAAVWYSHAEAVTGTVTAKWTEVSTSCDSGGGNCHTNISYLFQLDEGGVYRMFWGTRDWDKVQIGMKIEFEARGYSAHLFGWRLFTPDVFKYVIVPQ